MILFDRAVGGAGMESVSLVGLSRDKYVLLTDWFEQGVDGCITDFNYFSVKL